MPEVIICTGGHKNYFVHLPTKHCSVATVYGNIYTVVGIISESPIQSPNSFEFSLHPWE
jgi:hypothetical protein